MPVSPGTAAAAGAYPGLAETSVGRANDLPGLLSTFGGTPALESSLSALDPLLRWETVKFITMQAKPDVEWMSGFCDLVRI